MLSSTLPIPCNLHIVPTHFLCLYYRYVLAVHIMFSVQRKGLISRVKTKKKGETKNAQAIDFGV